MNDLTVPNGVNVSGLEPFDLLISANEESRSQATTAETYELVDAESITTESAGINLVRVLEVGANGSAIAADSLVQDLVQEDVDFNNNFLPSEMRLRTDTPISRMMDTVPERRCHRLEDEKGGDNGMQSSCKNRKNCEKKQK